MWESIAEILFTWGAKRREDSDEHKRGKIGQNVALHTDITGLGAVGLGVESEEGVRFRASDCTSVMPVRSCVSLRCGM